MIYHQRICIHIVHPFNPAIDPLWESRSDWDIYKTLAKAFSEMAKDYLPGTFKDVVTTPLSHDTKQEKYLHHMA